MTIPPNINLPLHSDFIKSRNPADQEKYMRELVFSLETMYETLATAINGEIRSDTQIQRSQWKPELGGSTTGTFTYDHQTGWSIRRGLIVDVWGDVEWTATTATGDLFVVLPYKVARSSNIPFVGIVQPSSITFTTGTDMVINAMPNTFNAEFWNVGNGVATGNQQVVSSGRLIFYIRYLAQDDET